MYMNVTTLQVATVATVDSSTFHQLILTSQESQQLLRNIDPPAPAVPLEPRSPPAVAAPPAPPTPVTPMATEAFLQLIVVDFFGV